MAAGRGELTRAGAGVASRWYETRICSSRPSYQEMYSANGATGAEPLREPSAIPAKTGEPADVVAVVTITVSGLRKAMCRSCSSTATPALVQGRVRDFVRSWPNQTESPFPESISSRRTAQMRSARQWRSWCCEGAQTAGRSLQGRASKTRLNGVSAARRNRVKPPSFTITFVSRCSPACAPSAGPCCASETGTQMSDDAP